MSWTEENLHIIKLKKLCFDVGFIAMDNAIL